MITAEETLCPQCARNGQKKSLILVFFKSQEGLYTCEDKTCTYFVTDIEGNLVKFNKDLNTTSYILDRTPKRDVIDDELDHFFDSLEKDRSRDKGNDENNCSFPAQNIVQVSVSEPCETELLSQNYGIKNEDTNATENLKVEEIFKTDCSELNFDDFL